MIFLSDDKINLRAVEPQDASIMWAFENDSDQWIHNSMSAPYSFNNLKDYAENYDADPFRAGQIRLIIESLDKEVLGVVDLYDISAVHHNAFIGIYIKSEYRNSGIATQAIILAEKYAHKLLNIAHICAKIMGTQSISVRLFEKCGYKLRGNIPEWFKSGNENFDLLIYSKIL